MEKLKGTDEIKDFPNHYNKLVEEVEKLSSNTRGIKVATWLTALASIAVAMLGMVTFLQTFSADKAKAACLDRIDYVSTDRYQIIYLGSNGPTTKEFGNYDEATQWCEKVLFK